MLERQKLKIASLLYKYMFPLYRKMYFNFKRKKDRYHLELIGRFLKPGFNVLDIGGNIGFFTKFLSDCVGSDGHVYSFEPDKTNFMHLGNEMKNRTNVTLLQKAVASESGTLILYTSTLLNVDHRTYEPENYAGKYSVEKTSIDDFVAGRFKVDFIKMDIQGFEMDALRGMKKTIRANPQLSIFTEFWPYGLHGAGSSATEMYEYANDLGLKIFKVEGETISKMEKAEAKGMKVEYFTDTNVLLTRKNIL